MRYDLSLIFDLCNELGLSSTLANERLEITFRPGVNLCFLNADRVEDCLVGFDGTPWHTHDDFMFVDGDGNSIELNYFDTVAGLTDGQILICERWQSGAVADRWLIHRDCNDFNHEFKYMEGSEELRVWRPERKST